MSVAEELTFHLEDFDGPLELLLALVAKHKMDLHNIPILEVFKTFVMQPLVLLELLLVPGH